MLLEEVAVKPTTEPAKPRAILTLSVGLLGGLLLSVGVVIVLDGTRGISDLTSVDEQLRSMDLKIREFDRVDGLIDVLRPFKLTMAGALWITSLALWRRFRRRPSPSTGWLWVFCLWGVEGLMQLHRFLEGIRTAGIGLGWERKFFGLAMGQSAALSILLLLAFSSSWLPGRDEEDPPLVRRERVLSGFVVFGVICDWIHVLGTTG